MPPGCGTLLRWLSLRFASRNFFSISNLIAKYQAQVATDKNLLVHFNKV